MSSSPERLNPTCASSCPSSASKRKQIQTPSSIQTLPFQPNKSNTPRPGASAYGRPATSGGQGQSAGSFPLLPKDTRGTRITAPHPRTPSPPSTCARTRARARGVRTACFIFSQGKPSPNPIHFPACALNCASNARIRASSLSALFCWRAAQWRPPSSSSSSSASRYGGGAKPDGL